MVPNDLPDYACTNANCKIVDECSSKVESIIFGDTVFVEYKRFYYIQSTNKYIKLSDSIISGDTITCPSSKCVYDLAAYVVHIGNYTNDGHYIACV